MIDEISMVGSAMFYKISNRLQDVMNNTEPFGGKNIVVLGDLFQIIPVGDSSLFTILPLQ
jgi:PIF1-like helicase